MKTIQGLLSTNLNTQTKTDIIELLKGIKSLLGSEYEEIVGINDSELPKLKKAELINVVRMIADAYEENWENISGNQQQRLESLISKFSAQEEEMTKSDAANADFTEEIGSIDFAKLIGGPLNACVTAQTNASVATANFIKEVGFKEGGKDLVMVDFTHNREVPAEDGSGSTTSKEVKLTVPLISILNIPSLRIENITIDFNVKLNSTYSKNINSSIGVNANAKAGWGPVKMSVSASYRRSSSTGVKVEKEYSMNVKVLATNDEMPAGLEKVLGMLGA